MSSAAIIDILCGMILLPYSQNKDSTLDDTTIKRVTASIELLHEKSLETIASTYRHIDEIERLTEARLCNVHTLVEHIREYGPERARVIFEL